ncbi:MAG: 4-(cytidine 5'-diphospho)-2-C-methyl-D-erythritol kinase [Campylobacterales bacterium]|nr:4-(cytidine 5'-diphospho)-2-C-methyl-D-erythritol kinase [Campylobacterales bacterium]
MTFVAPAKINIFLKITGTRGAYHELASRFVRVDALHDTLSFVPKSTPRAGFELEGMGDVCGVEENTLTKAYRVLERAGFKKQLEDFFTQHALHVNKHIPQGAGLGGGSSDAGAFLRACNSLLSLGLSVEALAHLGAKVGADVPFFVYDIPSANVRGIGEMIMPFEEDVPLLEWFTPPVFCATPEVYKAFREDFLGTINPALAEEMLTCKSETLLREMEAHTLNDLLAPALALYPTLVPYVQGAWKMSGSGSTLFRIQHHG